MINLLPDVVKEEIVFGRRNLVLRRWILLVFIVVIGVGAMGVIGNMYINKNIKTMQSVAEITQARISSQNLESTQNDIKNLSNNFKTVTQLLSKQLLFSKLFVKIGGIIPNGAILSGITINDINSALDLNIASLTKDAANQSFINISDTKNGLFDKADLISINCSASTEKITTKYPCTANIKVVMKADSSFYFLNSITGSGAKNS